MITIDHPERDIPAVEFFDNGTQEFVTIPERHLKRMHLQLEHSLMSVAKWEGIWHESFTEQKQLNGEKLLSYIRCMTINTQKDPEIYDQLSQADLLKIVEYMQDPRSAWKVKSKGDRKPIKRNPQTAEEFYHAMIQFGVPWDCEKWHFNRLIALLDYCGTKGSQSGYGGEKKRTEKEILDMYRAMNERNRKRFKSKG